MSPSRLQLHDMRFMVALSGQQGHRALSADDSSTGPPVKFATSHASRVAVAFELGNLHAHHCVQAIIMPYMCHWGFQVIVQ